MVKRMKDYFGKRDKIISCMLFMLVLITELVFGYYFAFTKKTFPGDALSRTANAFYVIFSQPPHLGSIGFIWNPLPSLLQLPLVIFYPIFKGMVANGYSGTIVTAIFSSLACSAIYKSYRKSGVGTFGAIIITLLFGFNPYVFIYGLNGMSEAIFFYFILCIAISFTDWEDDPRKVNNLIKMSIFLALAFLTRYEAIPLAAAIFVSIALWAFTSQKGSFLKRWPKFEATCTVLFTPLLYTILIWILINWIIMGNPLYFLNSSYSNEGQSSNINDPSLINAVHNVKGVIVAVGQKIIYFLPITIGVFVLKIINKNILKKDTIYFLIFVVSIAGLQAVMIFRGVSASWIRYYAYVLPVGAAWYPYEIRKMTTKVKKTLATIITMIFFIFTAFSTYYVMGIKSIAHDEYLMIKPLNSSDMGSNGGISVADINTSNYINKNCNDGKILLDTFMTFKIVVNIDKQANVVTSSSYIFHDAINAPAKNKIKYIVIPNPTSKNGGGNLSSLDAINKKYPNLYKNGATWCKLKVEIDNNFKIYEVN